MAGTHRGLRYEREGKKGGDIITDSIIRHPPSLRLSFKLCLPDDLTFSLNETLTLSAAKLGLRLGLRSEAAAKFCSWLSIKKKNHDVFKRCTVLTKELDKKLLFLCVRILIVPEIITAKSLQINQQCL